MLQRIQELDDRFAESSKSKEQPGFVRILTVAFAHSGDSWFWVVGLGLLWWWGTNYWRQLALVMFIGIVITALIVLLIKFTVRRRRPQGEWGRIYRSTDPHSFPSGHAARSAMLAVIALGLGPLWLGLSLLLWAPMVSLARIILGVHYPSDVFVGMVLGIVMGVLILIFV